MAAAGFTNIFASHLRDAAGTPITNATAVFSPNLSFRTGGAQGQVALMPVSAAVTNGSLSTVLADTSISNPANVSYKLVITDNLTGDVLLGKGYEHLQPSGSSWSLDDYIIPINGPLAVIVAGPQGTQGAQGVQGKDGIKGDAGTTTLDSANGRFSAGGGFFTNRRMQTTTQTPTNDPKMDNSTILLQLFNYGDGFNRGNNGTWSADHALNIFMDTYRRGINQPMTAYHRNFSIGDKAGLYIYNHHAGGILAPSDEGATGLTIQNNQWGSGFIGTIASTTGQGDTAPTLSYVTGLPAVTDGGILLNLDKSPIHCTISGDGQQSPLSPQYLRVMPVTVAGGGTLPLTTAAGVCSDQVPISPFPDSHAVAYTATMTLYPINGITKPYVVGRARRTGGFTEQVQITSVQAVSPGATTQQITFLCRYPGIAGWVFQGGIDQCYMSFDADLHFSGGDQYKYTTFPCLGSLDGHSITYYLDRTNGVGDGFLPLGDGQADTKGGGFMAASYRYKDANGNRTRAGVTLYMGAEITATQSPELPSSLISLEYNNVPWAVGDRIHAALPNLSGGNGLWIQHEVNTPALAGFANSAFCIDYKGFGLNSAFNVLQINANNYDQQYKSHGGPLGKPNGIAFTSNGAQSAPVSTYLTAFASPDPLSIDPHAAFLRVAYSSNIPGHENDEWAVLALPNMAVTYFYNSDKYNPAGNFGGTDNQYYVKFDFAMVENFRAQQATLQHGSVKEYLDILDGSYLRIRQNASLKVIDGAGQLSDGATQDVTLTPGGSSMTLHFVKGVFTGAS